MKRLIVVVPSFQGGVATWAGLLARLRQEPALEGSQWHLWDHGKRWYDLGDPRQLSIALRAEIDGAWAKDGPFDEIILAGHSLGGLLVRQAYVLAQGVDDATRQAAEWASRVSRIVLFAAVNRGADPGRVLGVRLLAWLSRLFPPVRSIVAYHLIRGSAFITNLRIEWIRLFARLGEDAPLVVQLLGTEDGLVARADSVDVEQFRSAYHIDVPGAGHGDLQRLDKLPDADLRYALLRQAFLPEVPANAENIVISGPERVVFVVHGIRASNKTWVKDTAEVIRERWPDVCVETSEYGFFSALRFALPSARRKKARWLLDRYSEALGRNPRATFGFIGHSNGTYLLGECLKAVPAMRFDRAVLVGSVLPADYDWHERFENLQVRELRVDGSDHDLPVGWLCSALRGLGMKDVGTGGVSGFQSAGGCAMHEFLWYRGGHSAPLQRANLPRLAAFAVDGTVDPPSGLVRDLPHWFRLGSNALARLAPLIAGSACLAFAWFALTTWPLSLTVGVLAGVIAVVLILDFI